MILAVSPVAAAGAVAVAAVAGSCCSSYNSAPTFSFRPYPCICVSDRPNKSALHVDGSYIYVCVDVWLFYDVIYES